jgi:septal ring factor EnvC (AmiA/AmiB activator)
LEIQVGVLIAIIGILCTFAGLVIGLLTLSKNRDKDVRNDASEFAVIKTTLGNINTGVESIRVDIKSNERRVTDLSEKVIRMDESLKSAHKRMDKLDTKGDAIHD